MATIMIGSARIGENGKIVGGVGGDQKQSSSINDTKGEVSMQPMYKHSKGWYVLRPKDDAHAGLIACKMVSVCNNKNIGYNQNDRLGIIRNGTGSNIPTNCDCSSAVRACVKEATGVDSGNFTTFDEMKKLQATGLFNKPFEYVSQERTPLYNGDILVTKRKGHTAIVVSGNPRVVSSNPKKQGQFIVPMPTLRFGSCGIQVRYLQIALNHLIHTNLILDGEFGNKTKDALKEWQKMNGLVADGIYGKISLDTMTKQLK